MGNLSFEDFFDNYLVRGFFIALVICIVFFIVSGIISCNRNEYQDNEYALHQALRKDVVDDSISIKAAEYIAQIIEEDSVVLNDFDMLDFVLDDEGAFEEGLENYDIIFPLVVGDTAIVLSTDSWDRIDKLLSSRYGEDVEEEHQWLLRFDSLSTNAARWHALQMVDKDRDYATYLMRNQGSIKRSLAIPQKEMLFTPADWSEYWEFVLTFSLFIFSFALFVDLGRGVVLNGESFYGFSWNKPWTYLLILFLFPWLCIAWLGELLFVLLPTIVRQRRRDRLASTLEDGSNRDRLSSADWRVLEIEEKKTRAREIMDKVHAEVEDTRAKFVDLLKAGLERKEQLLTQTVDDRKGELRHVAQELKEAQRSHAAAQASLREWKKNLPALRAKEQTAYGVDFDRILAMPLVRTAAIDDRYLYVYTDVIYNKMAAKRYEIGMFKICVPLYSDRSIEVENLSSTSERGWDHPYAHSRDFCWGKLRDSIYDAIREQEYATAVDIILLAMQSTEGDSQFGCTYFMEV